MSKKINAPSVGAPFPGILKIERLNRRAFLQVLAVAPLLAAIGRLTCARRQPTSPLDRDLAGADFYAPHDLAG